MKKIQNDDLSGSLKVILSNVLAILVSLLAGFVVPKELSIQNYAEYKTYILYIEYVGIFHLGLVNGIYLKYGHLNYNELPYLKIRSYFNLLFIWHTVVQILLFSIIKIYVTTSRGIHALPLYFVILNLIFINLNYFFSMMNQCTKRFILDSRIVFFQTLIRCCSIGFLWLFKIDSYIYLLIIQTVIQVSVFIVYLVKDKELIFGKREKLAHCRQELIIMEKNGFAVLLSEWIGIFIFNLDSIFVNMFFSSLNFAYYSFAMTIVLLVIRFINIVSKLIFPFLIRVEESKRAVTYDDMSCVLSGVSALALSGFYIIKKIILCFLPHYDLSIRLVSVLMIIIFFKVLNGLVCGNFYKILGCMSRYTINNLLGLCIGIGSNIVAYMIWRSVYAIALASVLTFLIWYINADIFLSGKLGIVKRILARKYCFIAFAVALYFICMFLKWYLGILIYLLGIVVIFVAIYYQKIQRWSEKINCKNVRNEDI